MAGRVVWITALIAMALWGMIVTMGQGVNAGAGPVSVLTVDDPVLDGDYVEDPDGAILTSVSTVLELMEALDEAVPGEVIELADGKYDADGMLLIEQKNGTALAPIIIRAENPGKAVIVGKTWFRVNDSSYVVIQDLRFETDTKSGGANRAIMLYNSDHSRVTRNDFALEQSPIFTNNGMVHWVMVHGPDGTANDNRIDHNRFTGKTQSGHYVAIEGNNATGSPGTGIVPLRTRVDHNLFRDVTPSGSNGAETIRIGAGSQTVLTNAYAIVEYNVFDNCSGESEIISVKSSGNTLRYNLFLESQGGLVLRYGNGSEVYGNTFIGNGKPSTAGVRIHGTDHRVYNNYFTGLASDALNIGWGSVDDDPTVANVYWQVKRTEVAFNTFAYNQGTVFSNVFPGGDRVYGPIDTVVDNNVVIGAAGTFVREVAGGHPFDIAWAGNMMYPTGSATLGVTKTSGEIEVTDPLFVLGGDGMYRPSGSSPTIDAAIGTYAWVTEDWNGQARGANPDIGAMEYNASLPSYTPPLLTGQSPIVEEIGTMISATSSEDGAIYLLPGGLVSRTAYVAMNATGWFGAGGKMTAAVSGVPASLDTSGLSEGLYGLYAIDEDDNISDRIRVFLVEEADFTAVVDDSDSVVSESGTWVELVGSSYFLGTLRRSNENGAYADIPFYGKQAKLYATTASSYGLAEIYVDNVYHSTIDLYSASTQHQQLVFDTGLLTEGNHTVRIKVIRQRNGASQGFYVSYDMLKVVPENLLSPGLHVTSAGQLEVGDSVTATSTKDGTLFLVPKSTAANRTAIEAAAVAANGTSALVTANVNSMLDTTGFASGLYVVYAMDGNGSLSARSTDIVILEPEHVDDRASAVAYSGAWTEIPTSSAFLGTVKRANQNVDYVDIPFYGQQARLYATTGSNYGKAEIYVDNVYRATVDFYSATAQHQQLVFDTGLLPEDDHTVRIKVLRQRNEVSQGFYVTFDVLKVAQGDELSPGLSDVTSGPLTGGEPVMATSSKDGTLYLVPESTPANPSAVEAAAAYGTSAAVTANVYGVLDTTGFTTGYYVVYATDSVGNLSSGSPAIFIQDPNDIDDKDASVNYSGTWTEIASPNSFLGGVRRANQNGDFAEIPFYGTRAKLYAALNSNYGKADIYVDGVYQATVDFYSPTSATQQEIFDTGLLAEDDHTVKIVVLRQRNSASQGFYVTFDVLKNISE